MAFKRFELNSENCCLPIQTSMMRLLLLLLIGFFLGNESLGQNFEMPKMDTALVPTVDVTSWKAGRFLLEMPYAKSHVDKKPSFDILSGKDIRKVQLVYTDYPKGASLHKLNESRLRKLYHLYPAIFDIKDLQWELVKQTNCSSKVIANAMYHGFIIWYAESGLESGRGKELEDLKKVVQGDLVPTDSTILKVMERNKDWDNMLVIADLTGSMSPYVGQLLLWIKLKASAHPAKHFVFFNDGDDKMNKEKKIGETGGLYSTPYDSMDALLGVVAKTIKNGWGGDSPENNMEAVLQGIKDYPDFEQLVMIADNGAVPRDLVLMRKIHHPMKIILCGTKDGVNPIYLDIARKNKGSIHTIEQDLEDLMKMTEGEIIDVGAKRFQVKNGEFIEVKIEEDEKDDK